jgi:hypothetical protein
LHERTGLEVHAGGGLNAGTASYLAIYPLKK